MTPNPINKDRRDGMSSLEARSARPRRYSIDQARADYYHESRTRRYARRMGGR